MRTEYKVIIAILALPLIAPEASAQSSDNLTLSLRGASVNKVLRVLAEKTGKNLIADPSISDTKVSVDLSDVPIDEAMSIILETNNLGIRRKGNTNIFVVDRINKILSYTEIISVKVQYAEAKELQKILSEIVTPEVGSVLADERTNTLIIKENPERLNKIVSLIRKLDRPTYQVSIQAAIIEVSTNEGSETGVDWLWKDPGYKNIEAKAATSFNQRLTSPIGRYIDNEGNRFGVGLPTGDGLGFGIVNAHVDVVLHALSERNSINLLSRPKLVTLDNQEAEIEVGDQIPYRVLNQFGVTSTEFKNASILLRVKPHVNNDNTVTLQVEPHADFQNGVTSDGTPIIATRRANTRIKVNHGSTVVIGGLMRNSKNISESRVPVLGRIPLISFFFKKKVVSNQKTELVVLVMPHILNEDTEFIEVEPEKGIFHIEKLEPDE